ncbi:MAG: restriction endonuclease subunit S [Fibrobacter sp.]|nr:restriction endonuclease subunit S [Fibrobacter sp.]
MKKNWEYKTLNEACNINFGTRVVQKKDGGSIYDVYGGGGATFKIDRYNREDCFIVSRFAMSLKCTRFVSGKFFLNDSGLSVSTNNENLSQQFVDAFLLSSNDKIYSLGKGAAQRNLDMASFRQLIIPVPPMSEQERIVAELDLLNGVLEKQKAQLKELDTLAQSIFYDMFGDLEMKDFVLVDLCKSKDDIKCGPFGTQLSKAEYKKEGIAVWGIPQINSRFSILPTDFVTHEKAEALKDYSVIPGDIVMSRKGNVGQCSVFPYSFEPGIIHSDVLRLRLNENVANPVFMEYQLHLSDMIKHQIQLVSSGAIMPGINVTKLKSIRVQVPPLSLQQSFADKIASIEKQKAAINQSIAETQKLLDYTMDKYFG